MKKQYDDKEVKEDEAQPSNSEPKNHSSASESSSDPVTAVKASRLFHLEWKATFPWVYVTEEKISRARRYKHQQGNSSRYSLYLRSFIVTNSNMRGWKTYHIPK